RGGSVPQGAPQRDGALGRLALPDDPVGEQDETLSRSQPDDVVVEVHLLRHAEQRPVTADPGPLALPADVMRQRVTADRDRRLCAVVVGWIEDRERDGAEPAVD